jgi:D-alanyl-D-alanine carboxypeptidase
MKPMGVKVVALIALASAGSVAIMMGGAAMRRGPTPPSPDTVVLAGSPGALALVDDGSSRREAASGLAVLRGRVPLHARDRFRIGSITKTFVAVVVLQLVDEHRLRLGDTLERWLPGLVPGGGRITVRELLGHTSGLADYASDAAFVRRTLAQPRRRWAPRELVRVALARGPVARPGERFAYASTNYVLLGMVVERASGTSLEPQLRSRIFAPLGLRDTTFAPGPRIQGRYAHGYAPSEHDGIIGNLATARDRSGVGTSWVWAAGAIVSTASDL